MEKIWDVAWRFLRVWPLILRDSRNASRGDVFEISFGKAWKVTKLKPRALARV
jgi:hypothetical protein